MAAKTHKKMLASERYVRKHFPTAYPHYVHSHNAPNNSLYDFSYFIIKYIDPEVPFEVQIDPTHHASLASAWTLEDAWIEAERFLRKKLPIWALEKLEQ